jgi:hypothetical protein
VTATFYKEEKEIGKARTNQNGVVEFEGLPAGLVESLMENGVIGSDENKKLRRLRVEDGDLFIKALPREFKSIYLWAKLEKEDE